ncbi:hypothetical protein HPB49_011416 [Dermacentor silvarum]|uniref:Uncharacterized protein n=1 Tax=Dermacentor silvarum TaxID=543639 RepID=A0ACB8CKZ9_DERSI|nr:hypothetical protein HPB49_011416 [Dermacentor silvarum]
MPSQTDARLQTHRCQCPNVCPFDRLRRRHVYEATTDSCQEDIRGIELAEREDVERGLGVRPNNVCSSEATGRPPLRTRAYFRHEKTDSGGAQPRQLILQEPSKQGRARRACGGCGVSGTDLEELHANSLLAHCEPSAGLGFRRGGYRCRCREGFYAPALPDDGGGGGGINDDTAAAGSGEALEAAASAEFRCLPCPSRCGGACQRADTAEQREEACFVQYNMAWRTLALGLQGFCTSVTVVLMAVVFRLRKSKHRGFLALSTLPIRTRQASINVHGGARSMATSGGPVTVRQARTPCPSLPETGACRERSAMAVHRYANV